MTLSWTVYDMATYRQFPLPAVVLQDRAILTPRYLC
jgi:hypothetical protein